MNVQKYNLQPHEPRDVLREVIYEIELLVATSIIPSYNPLINVALLESRLLHTRNLIAFFEMKSRTTYRTSDARIENDDVLYS
jgi:hypothetical protein